MEYIESINIFGKEYKPNSCIILESRPTTDTPGLVGMLAMDTSSENKDLYKCISVDDENYQWVTLGSGSGNNSAKVVEDLDSIEEPDEFTDYYVKSGSKYLHYRWSKELNDFVMIGTDAYSKSEIDTLLAPINEKSENNTLSIQGLNNTVDSLVKQFNDLDKSPRLTYEATYGTIGPNGETIELENYEVKESTFILWETEGANIRNAKSVLNITGGGSGGGGATNSNVLTISYVTDDEGKNIAKYVFTEDNNKNNETIIEYIFSGTTPNGDSVLYGEATWKMRRGTSGAWTKIAEESIEPAEENKVNSFNVSKYLTSGSYQISLTVTDDSGGYATKTWSVQIVDFRIESSFNDTIAYPIAPVSFTYTSYGSIEKTIYIKLDGNTIAEIPSSTSGVLASYSIPAQSHGAHLLEIYAKAMIGARLIETNHVFKDILWYDNTKSIPVIGVAQQNIIMDQYDTINISYTVFDPLNEKPTITIKEGENVLATRVLSQSNTDVYAYKAMDVFEGAEETHIHNLIIQCGNTEKTITITVKKIGINIVPATGSLAFDFNPIGYSNDSPDKLWIDSVNSNIRMTVSDEFDWINGGYKYDNAGDQYFCIKAGSSAVISYKLFSEASLTKTKGKDFKLIFRTANVSNPKATFLSCIDKSDIGEITSGYYFEGNFYSEANKHDATHLIEPQVNNRYFDNYNERYYRYVKIEEKNENGEIIREYYTFVEDTSDIIGIEMKAHEAYIYDRESKYLYSPYSEDDIIEFEFNINKNTSDIPMIMGYEDGVATTPLVYGGSSSFNQRIEQEITLGSPYCDLWIYRLKVYERELSDVEILNNFIADARSPEEMISRYNRNQIYDTETAKLTPSSVADACPWLRVIKIDTPYFTNDKDNRVKTNYIEQIYKNGTLPTDNWIAYDAAHSGQGTSSNNYGPAGRNLDLMLKKTKDKETNEVINPDFEGITIKDAQGNETIVNKIPLTDNSVPVNYFNLKVNIASSENANNALLQKRYNDFNPYNRPFVRDNEEDKKKIKDTMEFYNCVVFLRESDETKDDQGKYINHREFNDTDWHFYAIGNIGDSKKTDDTRLTDPTDPYECINEIIDVDVPLASFPSGDAAIAILEADNFDKSGSYEWRYIWKDDLPEGVTELPETYCRQKWIDFYKFVVNSTDEEFKRDLSNYFVIDSALYYYLYTTRFTMVDNRAKNSFWHYGKTGEVDSNGDPIRKWDLSFDYDNDTALGIDNDGDMVYRYGLEDIDVDENGIEVFRVSNSTFFRRIRDLFAEELANLYKSLSDKGAWSANDTITTFDAWQNQFPEELWRLDIERKYLRTYTSSYIDGQPFKDALTRMAHGKKKYQRREFERNQEKYMASKYLSSPVLGDKLTIRCADTRTDNIDSTSKANYTINITPYSYMYLQAQYGNGNRIEPVRAEPGKTYPITPPEEKGFVDIIDIYGSEGLQSIGDISALYPKSIIASTAKKLKELQVGGKSISNTNFEELSLGGKGSDDAEPLIETLSVENISGTKFTSLDLSNLRKLKTLKASGAGIQSVEFANQGLLENAELPPVRALFMSNLKKLDKVIFDNDNYEELRNLFIEDSNIDNDKDGVDDLLKILPLAINLERVRITGINWELENTSILDVLYTKKGYGRTKTEEISQSVLEGNIKITGIYLQRDIERYRAVWPNLIFDLGDATERPTYRITYENYDGTVLYEDKEFYVAAGDIAIDPVSQLGYEVPLKPYDEQYKYVFKGWSNGSVIIPEKNLQIFQDTVLTAVYDKILQTYSIKWMSNGQEVLSTSRQYGDSVDFDTELEAQEKTFEKSQFYQNTITGTHVGKLFTGWDKSTSFITRDTSDTASENFNEIIVNAKWQEGNTAEIGTKTLNELTPAQIYAAAKSKTVRSFRPNDYFETLLGNEFDYDNIQSDTMVSINDTKFFRYSGREINNQQPITTAVTPLKEISSFTLAIDFEFTSFEQAGLLLNCYAEDNRSSILSISCPSASSGSPLLSLSFGGKTTSLVRAKDRQVIVLRYVKENEDGTAGNVLYVYTSKNVDAFENGNEIGRFSISGIDLSTLQSDNPITLGGADSTSYRVNANVYWCKIWYEDLGIDDCLKMAQNPREILRMRYCGTERYSIFNDSNINDDSQKTGMSFICDHVLDKQRYVRPTSISSNEGGWGTWKVQDGIGQDTVLNPMREFLEKNIYLSLPQAWQSAISPIKVVSTKGNNSTLTTFTKGHLYVPSVAELIKEPGTSYYAEGSHIDFISSNSARSLMKGRYTNVNPETYMSISEPIQSQGISPKLGDKWQKLNSSGYGADRLSFWVPQEEVIKYGIVAGNYDTEVQGLGIWLCAIIYSTRSPAFTDTTTSSLWVNMSLNGGLVPQATTTGPRGVCPCFSI